MMLLLGCVVPDPPKESADTAPPTSTAPATFCPDGLPAAPWSAEGTGEDYGALAADVTIATTVGDLVLSERWTGCDGWVFLGVNPGDGYTGLLLDESMKKLLRQGPEDAIYVLFADGMDGDTTRVALASLLAEADPDGDWANRVYIATDRATSAPGWVGTLLVAYAYPVFGIDRQQRLREVGYLADPKDGWASVPWLSLGYEVEHYAFEAAREVDLEARNATVVPLWNQSATAEWTDGSNTITVELPDAATMAGFDRLDVDIQLDCDGPWYDSCPEWDTSNYVWVCDEDGSNCQELARLITGYYRGGRWIVDGRGQLGALADGGPKTFKYTASMADLVTVSLRLWSEGTGDVASGREQLWWDTSGFWTADFNAAHSTTVDIPADASRVELFAIMTGHGSDGIGCGEFCTVTHHFDVNGVSFETDFTVAGTEDGCLDQIGVGALPNQGGTWTYGRAGWCPGMGVDPLVFDITSAVSPGTAATVTYKALRGGEEYTTDSDGNQDIGVWLNWYR